MAEVKLNAIRKSFGNLDVIRGVDLQIEEGEFVVFVGPSGSGKSTMLRILAGLEEITSGDVSINGRDVTYAAPGERGIAMVFQTYALYPHMSVFENIAFNLRLNKLDKAEIDKRVRDAARILKLTDYLERKPSQLSGGQRQRVAIGRAIVRHPDVFLFDEPLSNLDAALRIEMRLEIEKLHHELGATMVYVTHDQVEAMTLADRIVAFDDGLIQQIGTPLELYRHPSNLFVAGFIGSPKMNFLPAVADGSGTGLVASNDSWPIHLGDRDIAPQANVTLGVRPEALTLNAAKVDGTKSLQLTGEITSLEQLGHVSYAHVQCGDLPSLVIQLSATENFHRGEQVSVTLKTADLHVFNQQGLAIPAN